MISNIIYFKANTSCTSQRLFTCVDLYLNLCSLTQSEEEANFLELVGSQTWSWLLLLGQRSCHCNRCGVGHSGEWGRPCCDSRRTLPLPPGCTFGLEDVCGVFQEGSTIGKVLMLQDLRYRHERKRQTFEEQ